MLGQDVVRAAEYVNHEVVALGRGVVGSVVLPQLLYVLAIPF